MISLAAASELSDAICSSIRPQFRLCASAIRGYCTTFVKQADSSRWKREEPVDSLGGVITTRAKQVQLLIDVSRISGIQRQQVVAQIGYNLVYTSSEIIGPICSPVTATITPLWLGPITEQNKDYSSVIQETWIQRRSRSSDGPNTYSRGMRG